MVMLSTRKMNKIIIKDNFLDKAVFNSIKNAIFVPPSHEHVSDLMSDIEKFLHNKEIKTPNLIKVAIAHYQFETIHPFLDGNGRIGRLMITLYLVSIGMLEKPLLYASDFFEKHKGL